MLSFSELPKRDGVPVGRYRVRVGTVTEAFFGCNLKEGESTHPVEGRYVARMAAAFGERCQIEPWDLEDARTVWQHLESVRTPEARMRAVGEAFAALFMPPAEELAAACSKCGAPCEPPPEAEEGAEPAEPACEECAGGESDPTGEQPSEDADGATTPSADAEPAGDVVEAAEPADEPAPDPEGEGPMLPPPDPDELDRMNRDALKAYAQAHDLTVDLRLGEAKLRAAIRAAIAEKPRG